VVVKRTLTRRRKPRKKREKERRWERPREIYEESFSRREHIIRQDRPAG
jgi:hypothetical protein